MIKLIDYHVDFQDHDDDNCDDYADQDDHYFNCCGNHDHAGDYDANLFLMWDGFHYQVIIMQIMMMMMMMMTGKDYADHHADYDSGSYDDDEDDYDQFDAREHQDSSPCSRKQHCASTCDVSE